MSSSSSQKCLRRPLVVVFVPKIFFFTKIIVFVTNMSVTPKSRFLTKNVVFVSKMPLISFEHDPPFLFIQETIIELIGFSKRVFPDTVDQHQEPGDTGATRTPGGWLDQDTSTSGIS